jgi:very-short-patch-repair endonuclease
MHELVTVEVSQVVGSISDMNGFGTVRTRPLPPGFLSAGWLNGNAGENRVIQALSQAGIGPASGFADALACHQQHQVGDHTLDFAWPVLKIALESDGDCHLEPMAARRDRLRDARLRAHGWLVFRVDFGRDYHHVTAQVGRVVSILRALSRASTSS